MRILQVIPSLAKGGAERLVVDLSNNLSQKEDVELIILTFTEKNDFIFLTNKLKIISIPATVIPSIKRKWLVEVKEVNDFINQFKPDIIHLHLFESIIVFSEIAYENAKYFIHFHDNMIQFSKLKWKDVLNKKRLTNRYEYLHIKKKYKNRNVNAISISSNNYNYVRDVVPKTWITNLLPNAVDLDRFKPSSFIKGNQLITIGNLNVNKNHVFLLQVMAKLISDGVEVDLTIVGDGLLKNDLRKEVERLNLQNYIHFTGAVDYPEIYLSKSSIYVHSAISEAFGLVFIEAMACGLPIVALDANGNRDLVKNNVNGFLIAEHEIDLFSKSINKLLKDKQLCDFLSSNSLQFSVEYSIEKYGKSLLELYQI